MPLCGFNARMIEGIAIFAQGLFEATVARARDDGVSIETAFEKEVTEISLFLEALELTHQDLKKKYEPRESMERAAHWIKENDN